MTEGYFKLGPGGGFMWLFWILLVIVIVWLVRGAFTVHSHSTAEKQQSALDILKLRYARGEIDRDEYKEKLRDLRDV